MKKILILAACLAIGASCSKVDTVEPTSTSTGNVSLTLENGAATRGDDGDEVAGSDAENKVSMLEIYVFNNDGTVLDNATANENGYIKLTAADLKIPTSWPYTTQVQMGSGTNKDIIVVANANLGAPVTTSGSEKLDTFEKVMQAISDETKDVMTTAISRVVPTDGFIMSGYTLGANVVAERSDNKISIKMDRLVARIEVPVQASTVNFDLDLDELERLYGDRTTKTDTDNLEFEFTGYAVINGLQKSSIGFVGNNINDGTAGTTADVVYSNFTRPYLEDGTEGTDMWAWNLWTANATAADGTFTAGAFATARGSRIESKTDELMDIETPNTDPAAWEGAYSGRANLLLNSGAWFIDSSNANPNVYLYESKPDTKANESYVGYDPDGVVAIIIQGTITDTSVTDPAPTKTRYWRLNVRVDEAYHIIRNSTYQTTISTIQTPGFASPQEAEDSEEIVAKPGDTVSEFYISVNKWLLKNVGNGQI